jgi:hypothetical protein
MRYLAVVLLALAGCGGQSHTQSGVGGQCAAAVVYHGKTYVRTKAARPALKGRLTGGYVPACNDHEGDPGTDQPVVLRRIAGTPASEAVYSRRPFPGVYRRSGSQP